MRLRHLLRLPKFLLFPLPLTGSRGVHRKNQQYPGHPVASRTQQPFPGANRQLANTLLLHLLFVLSGSTSHSALSSHAATPSGTCLLLTNPTYNRPPLLSLWFRVCRLAPRRLRPARTGGGRQAQAGGPQSKLGSCAASMAGDPKPKACGGRQGNWEENRSAAMKYARVGSVAGRSLSRAASHGQ